ncbi:MAG: hypothetical protein WCY09_08075 [Candidatus Omnitrophota bacterium]
MEKFLNEFGVEVFAVSSILLLALYVAVGSLLFQVFALQKNLKAEKSKIEAISRVLELTDYYRSVAINDRCFQVVSCPESKKINRLYEYLGIEEVTKPEKTYIKKIK